jgi:hypothetical protein
MGTRRRDSIYVAMAIQYVPVHGYNLRHWFVVLESDDRELLAIYGDTICLADTILDTDICEYGGSYNCRNFGDILYGDFGIQYIAMAICRLRYVE